MALCLFLAPWFAFAQTAGDGGTLPTLGFRIGEHPAFDRVVFDLPKGLSHTLVRDGGLVTVQFSGAAKIALTRNYLKRVKNLALVNGAAGDAPLSVAFFVSPEAKLKEFMSGPSLVIDVSGPVVKEEGTHPSDTSNEKKEGDAKASPLPPLPQEPAKAENAQPQKSEEPKTEKQDAQPTPSVEQPVKEPISTVTPPASDAVPQEQEKPVSAVQGPVAPQPEAAPRGKVEPAPVSVAANNVVSVPWPPPVRAPMDAKQAAVIQDILRESSPKPVVVFDPKIEVGAAVFTRAGWITVVFDRKLTASDLAPPGEQRVKFESIDAPQNTIFRIRVPEHVVARANRKDTAWEIYLVREGDDVGLTTDFIVQPEFALGARVLLPSAMPPQPVFYTDPIVGDTLVVLPLRETGAFPVKRRLSDFGVIPSAQGLVLKPWHERVSVRTVADGIEITAEGGLKLSSPQDTLGARKKKKNETLSKNRAFLFESWRGRPEDSFALTRHRLWQTIIDVSEDQRILARLDLARFYFAHVMGHEALAMLTYIAKKVPEVERDSGFLTLRGASRILVGQIQDGLNDLTNSNVKPQDDVTLWRAVGSGLLRDWATSIDLFRLSMPLLSTYPEPLRSRFTILAIEAAVATGHDADMVAWLSKLEDVGVPESAQAAVMYLRGVVHSRAGRVDLAEKLWKKVTRKRDRLYKIRAELALIDLGVATRSLTAKQAVERLEGLRFAWRGDDLELDILKRLAVFYVDDKRFREGFTVLFQAIRLYPNAPQAESLRADMMKTFQDIYLSDLGKDISPIDALSLYTDFRTLIPKGEDGNAVREVLAERLVDIDLLDPAIKLLEEVMQNSSKPDEKARLFVRMAGIRLLDHKAQEALDLLDKNAGDLSLLSQAVKDERQLLKARALSELGKYPEALAMLPSNSDRSTLLLRADMAMRAKVWPDASKALLELVGKAPAPDAAPLTEEKAGWVVNAAMAMAHIGDTNGLDRLAIDYGAAMDRTSKANVFRVLTQPQDGVQMKDIRAAQARVSEVDMFRDVLNAYRKAPPKDVSVKETPSKP